MISPVLEEELHAQLEQLPLGQQRQVLDFARALVAARPQGVPGSDLLRFAGVIGADDLKTIAETIEHGCETVNVDEW